MACHRTLVWPINSKDRFLQNILPTQTAVVYEPVNRAAALEVFSRRRQMASPLASRQRSGNQSAPLPRLRAEQRAPFFVDSASPRRGSTRPAPIARRQLVLNLFTAAVEQSLNLIR